MIQLEIYKVSNVLKINDIEYLTSGRMIHQISKYQKGTSITLRCQEYMILYLCIRNRQFQFLANILTKKLHLFKDFNFV